MPQPIARIYATQASATAAANDLRARGFSEDAIHIVSRPQTLETTAGPDESVMPEILQAGVSPAHAAVYAEGIHRGEVLVVVHPPFGSAQAATEILRSFDPLEVTVPEVDVPPDMAWDPAAPLSSWLKWPVLSSNPTPLSDYLKRPALKPEPQSSPTLESIRQQSLDAAPLSRKIKMRVLSDDPAPLSAKLGWSLLSDKAALLSEKLGWQVLSDNPAPLSSALGWSVLSSNPTPLSSSLGWSTQSKN